MIKAIGTDIIEISRVQAFVDRGPNCADRLFTQAEQTLAHRRGAGYGQFYAGRFAAKEAVAKCIGPPLKWHDVEILEDNAGKPLVQLAGEALKRSDGGRVLVTISHNQDQAVAFAILEEV